jgi:hypothetical protein
MSLAKAAKETSQATDRKIAKPYEPPSTPHVTVSVKKDAVHISLGDRPREPRREFLLLMEAMGTSEPDFCEGMLLQLGKVATQGQNVSEMALNFMISVIKGVEPKDPLEAMLAAQMSAVHMLTLEFSRRLNNVDNIPQQDSAERTLNKLARTFATQMETLKRHRSTEQRVVVEHVTVNDGGKAIVGAVTHHNGGPGGSEKRDITP